MPDTIEEISPKDVAKIDARGPVVSAGLAPAPEPSALPVQVVGEGISLHRNGANGHANGNGLNGSNGQQYGPNGNGAVSPAGALPANHWSKSNGSNGSNGNGSYRNGNGHKAAPEASKPAV